MTDVEIRRKELELASVKRAQHCIQQALDELRPPTRGEHQALAAVRASLESSAHILTSYSDISRYEIRRARIKSRDPRESES